MKRLLIATHNRDKLREFREIFAQLPVELLSLEDAGVDFEVDETGRTFDENAILKARAYCALSGMTTLADDSGLEVDALDGGPGVLSSRFAGPDAPSEQRNQFLLDRLQNLPEKQRTARYRCVIAIARPDGSVRSMEGTCGGQIARAPKGTGGFGYDPIFFLPEYGKTMAELSPDQKHLISHRGRAARKVKKYLRQLLGAN